MLYIENKKMHIIAVLSIINFTCIENEISYQLQQGYSLTYYDVSLNL